MFLENNRQNENTESEPRNINEHDKLRDNWTQAKWSWSQVTPLRFSTLQPWLFNNREEAVTLNSPDLGFAV